MKVTGEQVREAMIGWGITTVNHHECGACGFMVKYRRRGEQLFFDANCDCTYYGTDPRPSDWDEAAEFINIQNDPNIQKRIAESFGFLQGK